MSATLSQLAGRCLWFKRGEWCFAAPMEHLQEVLPLAELHTLATAEPSLAGFLVLREQVLPMFDPAALVSPTAAGFTLPAKAIVLSLMGRPVFALVAEQIGQVIPQPQPLPVTGAVRMPAVFRGQMLSASRERIFIVDAPAFAALMGLAIGEPQGALSAAS